MITLWIISMITHGIISMISFDDRFDMPTDSGMQQA